MSSTFGIRRPTIQYSANPEGKQREERKSAPLPLEISLCKGMPDLEVVGSSLP